MKNGTFTVIPQNMQAYQISERAADQENDLYREAFDAACKADQVCDPREAMLAGDFFKYGWEAAVKALNDDAAQGDRAAPVESIDTPAWRELFKLWDSVVPGVDDEEQIMQRIITHVHAWRAAAPGELPEVPTHPVPHTYQWTEKEIQVIQEWGASQRRAGQLDMSETITTWGEGQREVGRRAVEEIKRRLRGMIGNGDLYQQGYEWALEMVEIVEFGTTPAPTAGEPSAEPDGLCNSALRAEPAGQQDADALAPVAWRIYRSGRWCFAYSPDRHLCDRDAWEPLYIKATQGGKEGAAQDTILNQE